MEAIGDLGGLRRAAANRLGIRAVPIAADDHDVGMGGQPRRHRIGRAHREDVHDPPPLQIHEDRPVVVLALLPRPVIDADDVEDVRCSGTSTARRFRKRRIVSSLMAMPSRASSRSPPRPPNAWPTRCATAPNRCVWCTRGAETPANRSANSTVSHCAVSATPATDVHAQRDGSALRRQIFQRTPVAAMASLGRSGASGTPGGRRTVRLDHHTRRRGRHPDQRQCRRIREPLARRPGPFHRNERTPIGCFIEDETEPI